MIIEKTLLKNTTKPNFEINNLMVLGLDRVNTQSLPLNINVTSCDFILSSAVINKRNTDILGVVIISKAQLDCFENESGCFIWGCGVANYIRDDLRTIITNKLITHLKSLFEFGRKDNGSYAIDYFCIQPNTDEECEEIKNEYGMSRHSYEYYII